MNTLKANTATWHIDDEVTVYPSVAVLGTHSYLVCYASIITMGRTHKVQGKNKKSIILVGIHKMKRPLQRTRQRWEYNIKMYLRNRM
jgi:hypothetical protein